MSWENPSGPGMSGEGFITLGLGGLILLFLIGWWLWPPPANPKPGEAGRFLAEMMPWLYGLPAVLAAAFYILFGWGRLFWGW